MRRCNGPRLGATNLPRRMPERKAKVCQPQSQKKGNLDSTGQTHSIQPWTTRCCIFVTGCDLCMRDHQAVVLRCLSSRSTSLDQPWHPPSLALWAAATGRIRQLCVCQMTSQTVRLLRPPVDYVYIYMYTQLYTHNMYVYKYIYIYTQY